MAEEKLSEKSGGGVGQLREVFSEMPMGRRLAVMAAAAAVLAGFIALVLWVNQPSYQVLYANLAQKDASMVVEKLKELKTPYQLESGGSVIKVPKEKVYETRLAMASAGLPRGGGVGFEVFNEVKMGTTEFVQKINYQRALQGELARTIASFPEVDEARVHIVMPRDSLFVEEEKAPSAAVVLRLGQGRTLSKRQIRGIVYLVASSVPDLKDSHVTVVDANGNLLYRKEADSADFAAGLTASQLEYQRNYENGVKSKVQSMLEEVLGQGRAVVRVSADIDFTRTTTVEDLFNPDQVAVRSETRTSEKSQNTGPGPIGSPDNRFNLAQRNASPGQGAQAGSSRENENETTNFEISRTKKQTSIAIAGLKRLNVAVMVDGPYKEATDKEGNTTRTFAPRSAEEIRQLTELVRRAVGYDETRKDEVTVANVPFALPPGEGMVTAKGWQEYVEEYGRPVLNFVLILLFFLLVVRPLMKYLAVRIRPEPAAAPARRVGPGEELPPGAGEEEAGMLEEPIVAPRKLGTRDAILTLAQQDPERTTAVLRSWIHEV